MMDNSNITDYQVKHTLDSNAKLQSLSYGEWVEEPDLVTFKYKGIECKIERNYYIDHSQVTLQLGHLCGSIQVPVDHIWQGKGYYDIDVCVHGDLTYAEYKDDKYWIGFDCANADDLIPFLKKFREKYLQPQYILDLKKKYPDLSYLNEVYRNVEFVKQEIISLVDQMLKVRDEAESALEKNERKEG